MLLCNRGHCRIVGVKDRDGLVEIYHDPRLRVAEDLQLLYATMYASPASASLTNQ